MRNYIFIDSEPITFKDFDPPSKLEKYFKFSNGDWSSDYVGFIIKKNSAYISFPKHYKSNIADIDQSDLNLLGSILKKTVTIPGIADPKDLLENFALVSYREICHYYKQYGLFTEREKVSRIGYGSNINWKKTINKSPKIVSNNNLLFLPLHYNKTKTLHVFLTECMKFILHDGYQVFGNFFSEGIPFTYNYAYKFENIDYDIIISRLSLVMKEYFKDNEKKLIASMINYFKWKTDSSDTTTLLTKKFSDYWSYLINLYLNRHFSHMNSEGLLVFKKNCQLHNFESEFEHFIESEQKRRVSRSFKVRYDHVKVDNDTIYLFDSKYYSDSKIDMDYKQLTYDLTVRNKFNETAEVKNSLILPTSHDSHVKLHLDTTDIKNSLGGIKIFENYINLKEVLHDFSQT